MLNVTGQLTIDMAALRANYKLLQDKLAKGARCGAVLKANAYGLGAERVVQELYAIGCRDFYVANPDEGAALRPYVPEADIVILNGYYDSKKSLYPKHNLIPALGSFLEIKAYQALCQAEDKTLPAYLSINILMNRLGLSVTETEELIKDPERLEGIDIKCIMSHFACADIEGDPMTEEQYAVFQTLAEKFPSAEKSLSNSPGIFRSAKYHYDIVRPGMALYGLNPTPERENPMQPVVSLSVPIMRTRVLYEDARIGYNATYRFEKEAQVATVSAGYADGLFWSLSNRGALYWKGVRCPIRGRVSMDMTSVDLSDVPKEERPKPGDYMEVLGLNQSPADLARDAGSFDYEILTHLGPRYERIYQNSVIDDQKAA